MIPNTALTTAEIPVEAALRSSRTPVFKVPATILKNTKAKSCKVVCQFPGASMIVYASNRESVHLARLKLKQ